MENIGLVLRVIGATLICVAVWMAQMNERDICELQDAVQRLERREFYTITFTSAEEFKLFLEELQKLREEGQKDEETDETP